MTPFLPEADRLAAVREALPSTGAGIYLNTGIGRPHPGGDPSAMAEQSDRELPPRSRERDDFIELLERMDEARASVAAVAARGSGGDRPDPLDHRRR